MVELVLKNNSGREYKEVRDAICSALVGCPAFIGNDIIVSDIRQGEDAVTIVLGDENNKQMVCVEGQINKAAF